MTAQEIIETLGLVPLEPEGGFFVETHRTPLTLASASLGGAYAGPRSLSTAIYYLLTPETFSAMHRLPGDEVFHHYHGDGVLQLVLRDSGEAEALVLGPDLAQGMRPQRVVPGGSWQGARLVAGGRWALLGTTMAPGFDPADYEAGDRDALEARFPAHAAEIRALTR